MQTVELTLKGEGPQRFQVESITMEKGCVVFRVVMPSPMVPSTYTVPLAEIHELRQVAAENVESGVKEIQQIWDVLAQANRRQNVPDGPWRDAVEAVASTFERCAADLRRVVRGRGDVKYREGGAS